MSYITTVWDTQNACGDWAWTLSQIGLPAAEFFGSGLITFQGSAGVIAFQTVAETSDLFAGADLQSAVLISLFSDRLADLADAIPDGTTDRRGWWGDASQDYPIGSRLWLLARAKQIPATLQAAQAYCTEALQWMLDDAVVASLDVTCSFPAVGVLGGVINLYEASGQRVASYQWAWKGLTS